MNLILQKINIDMKQSNVCVLIIITSLFISCEKETELDLPVVFTGEVTNVDQSNATFNARIYNPDNLPVTESGFVWGLHSGDENDIIIQNTNDENAYSLKTNYNLLPGKTYYVRAFVESVNNIVYGREVSFKTDSLPINLGKWTKISDHPYTSNKYIATSFTYLDNTYFVLEQGEIYKLNHSSNRIDLCISNVAVSHSSFSCVYQNTAYIFNEDAFYKLDLPDFKSTKLREWATSKKYGCSGFLINDDIYIGLGLVDNSNYSKEIWKYNISSDTWIRMSDFPGEFRMNAYSFTLNGEWYLGGGFNLINGQWPYPKFTDLWKFNPETKVWQQKEFLPVKERDNLNLPATNNADFGYCVYKNTFWEYNPTFNVWEKMKNVSEIEEYIRPFIFNYKNNIYLIEFISYNVPDPTGYKQWMDFKLCKYEK